ncbi:uncharacterized protein Z518_07145 [Rhinocladiella mackenziei CBS 650.93]|uniref:Uncharacterized protein n=1 Tax=Rhinocladiella mackenziei CBS 650.93 TaxID=1442369 RepID=A0A0D2FNG9_9EURO|nr:uncharacterized protein Z518_07145 [Rhinocladiella mackenziei CBS 650.93]KIX03592.1 hypothetical protein Z518_07145 [Rhinocladiella mackenziei CBS 650.93]
MQQAKAVTIRPNESAGLAASRPAPRTFQFVTANPSSEAERSQNKILVRSNASNFHWRRVKKSSDPSANRGVSRRRPTNHNQTRSSKRALAPLTPQQYESSSTESERSTPKNEVDRDEHKIESPAHHSKLIVLPSSSLTTLIVSGHHDPFETYPCDLPKEFVSPILDQVNGFLSLMFPPARGQFLSPLAETWLRTTFRDRGLFHASLFCQLTRNRIFFSSAPETREQMQCYNETIRGVHERFKDAILSCEDENILSVYALSYHGELRRDPPAVAPSQGPLTTLQLLHIYGGRLETVQVHLQGLAKMLSLRGGISKIALPGLAQAISFGDIVVACQNIAKPMFPYVPMHDDVIGPLNTASRRTHPLVGLGKGFRVLPGMLSHEEVSKLLAALRWIIQYTFAVDDHVEGRPEAQALSALMDERNFVQHNLMLLTPDPSEIRQEHPMHRLSRLATVIYSLLVVFPLPAVAAPFHQLAHDVRSQLSQLSIQSRWTEAPDLILWITVMGAIAAVGSSDRTWYLSALDRLTRRLNIKTWASLKERLKMFLWFEYTNDSDGLKLWREIEESSVFRMADRLL